MKSRLGAYIIIVSGLFVVAMFLSSHVEPLIHSILPLEVRTHIQDQYTNAPDPYPEPHQIRDIATATEPSMHHAITTVDPKDDPCKQVLVVCGVF